MKSNIVPFLLAKNSAPSSDCDILVDCLREVIENFGRQEFALTLIETDQELLKKAA